MPITREGRIRASERNRRIVDALNRIPSSLATWTLLRTLTRLTKPRLYRGLRELLELGVLEKGWNKEDEVVVYRLTGLPIPNVRTETIRESTSMKEPRRIVVEEVRNYGGIHGRLTSRHGRSLPPSERLKNRKRGKKL